MKRKLHELAHARAGDKGDTLTLALFAYRDEDYALLRNQVTAEAVKRHLGHIVQGEVRRFEVPNRYRHLTRLELRFASWDLALVHLVDEQTGTVLCRLFPQDKTRNASGLRRSLEPVTAEPVAIKPAGGMAPLLASLIEQRAATGLPPAYLPKDEGEDP